MIKPKFYFLLSVLVTVGCSASMVSSPGQNTSASKFAPANENSRPGLIKYLNQGAASVISQRREDAYQQMYESCGGKYKIDSEGPRNEGGMAVPMAGGGTAWMESEYWFISFSCLNGSS